MGTHADLGHLALLGYGRRVRKRGRDHAGHGGARADEGLRPGTTLEGIQGIRSAMPGGRPGPRSRTVIVSARGSSLSSIWASLP